MLLEEEGRVGALWGGRHFALRDTAPASLDRKQMKVAQRLATTVAEAKSDA